MIFTMNAQDLLEGLNTVTRALSARPAKQILEGVLIAEWFNPAQSIEAGFDLDFFCHDGRYNYSSLFFFGQRGFGPNATKATPYFDVAGNGGLKEWYDLYTYQYDAVKGKGYVCMPTGNHDFNRVCTEGRTKPEELKVAMTFFLTMPGVPFIYYGDEIGLKQNPAAPSTEGSGFRAGCRIPMLWDGSAVCPHLAPSSQEGSRAWCRCFLAPGQFPGPALSDGV